MTRMSAFFAESRQEFKRVNWPDRATTIRYTGFVIALTLGLAVFLGLLDFIFVQGLQHLVP